MIESPWTILRRLPRTVRLLVTGSFVNRAGTLIVPYLTLVLRREFHFEPGAVAALLFAYGIGTLISILVGGVLTDRLGRRLVLVASLLGGGAIALALSVAGSLHLFVLLLLGFGFLAEMYRPASSAIIADLLPSSQRAVGFAALRVAVNLGFAVGMVVGGLLADWSWRALFLGDGLTTIAFGFLALFGIPETGPGRETSRSAPPPPAHGPWRDRTYLVLMLVSLVFSTTLLANFTVLPLTIALSAGYPTVVYGLVVGLNGVLVALFEISVVAWLSGFRRLRLAAAGVLLSGMGFALNGVAPHWAAYLAAVVTWTAGEILTMPQQMAFIADWSPPAARGRYLSFFTATFSLGWAINPILLLPAHAWLGDSAFWPLLGAPLVPAAALLLWLDRTADRPERLRGALGEATPPR